MGAHRGVLGRTMAPACIGVLVVFSLASCALLPQESPVTVPEDSRVATTVEPVMVVAGVDLDGKHVTVSGYIAGVIEDDGTCIFTLERDSGSIEVSTVGHADRNSTACGSAQVDTSELERGTWTATLSYSSPSTQSDPSTALSLEVP